MTEPVVRIPDAKVALSTASVYPESTATAFEIAARLGYDGVEVMVWTDPVSQDIEALRRLSDYHGVPILAVHAPCLLITQRVWSTDPWVKLQRARNAAEKLGASTVVVHPPFRWQRNYAREFVRGVWRMESETDVRFAVENMYPWRYAIMRFDKRKARRRTCARAPVGGVPGRSRTKVALGSRSAMKRGLGCPCLTSP